MVKQHLAVQMRDAVIRSELWVNHFGWIEGYTQVIGLAPSGRATVEALKMNRAGLVNMRHVLYMAGKHPPF